MTVEQGLRAEFHDCRKVLARALRAAREQGTLGDKYCGFDEDSIFEWGGTKEGWKYWYWINNNHNNPDQYLPEGYVDVDFDEVQKDGYPNAEAKPNFSGSPISSNQ